MLPNEVFALECLARYAREGLDVKQGGVHDGYQDEFAHCPYPRSMGNDGHYLTFYDHQKQGLLQSQDMDRCCFIPWATKLWLDTYPPNYFELHNIYDKYNRKTEAWKKAQSERMTGKKGALSNASKPLIVIKPDGTRLYFVSGNEALEKLKISKSSLSRYARAGDLLITGNFEGYQFFYEVKE